MQEINKILFGMYEKYQKHKMVISIIMIFVNLVLLAYFIVFIPIVALTPLSTWLMEHEEIWYAIYEVVNPFTIGSYLLGVVVLLQFIMYDGWIIKLLLSMFYGMVVFTTFIAIMGMTSGWELCIYLPHLIVGVLCAMATYIKRTRS